METAELSQQRSARMAELPDDCRVAGLERSAPLAREPNGQTIRIQQDARLTAAAIAAKRRLATGSPLSDYRGDV